MTHDIANILYLTPIYYSYSQELSGDCMEQYHILSDICKVSSSCCGRGSSSNHSISSSSYSSSSGSKWLCLYGKMFD